MDGGYNICGDGCPLSQAFLMEVTKANNTRAKKFMILSPPYLYHLEYFRSGI